MTKESKESSKIDQLNDHIDQRVEERADEKLAEFETAFMDRVASITPHTESRTDKWAEYKPGVEGRAFTTYVETALRSVQETGRVQNDLTPFARDKGFAKRFLQRSAPIAIGTDNGEDVLDKPLYQEIVALLRREMILDSLGITFVPLTSRTLDIPREIESASFAYTAETATINESQYDAKAKQLVAKKLAGRVGVTNDFLASNPALSAEWIANKLLLDYAETLQTAVIHGLSNGPQDLYTGIDAGNRIEYVEASGQKTDLDEYLQKFDDATEAVTDQKVRNSDIKVLCNTRHRNFLRRQRGSGGQFVFPEVRDEELGGYPLHISDDIGHSYDEGGNTDADGTRIFVGDFSSYWLGILQDAKLDFSEHSRFAADESEFRLTGHNDGILVSDKRLAVLSTDISN